VITNQLVTFWGFSSSVGMYLWHLWQHIFKTTTWLFTWYKVWKTWNQLGYVLLYVQLGSTLNTLIFQVLRLIKFAFTLTIELYILRCLCVQRSTTQIQNYHISFLTIVFTNFHPFPKPIQPSTFPYSMWCGKIFCQCGKIFDDVMKYSSMCQGIYQEYFAHVVWNIFKIFSPFTSSHLHTLMLTLTCSPNNVITSLHA
jgi:hypothetical protein